MMPSDTDSLIQTGLALLQVGEIDAALQRFAEARRQQPANPALLRIVATLHQRTGRFAEAWSAAETGLALLPDDAGFHDARLAAMGEAGFADAALTLAQQRATAGDPQANIRLAELLLKAGCARDALLTAKAILARAPDNPEALMIGAEAAFQSGDADAARRWLDRAATLEPENRSIRMARATMLLSLGDWDQGLRDYEYRLQPGGPETVIRTGLAAIPRWQMQDLRNSILLIVSEQGVGDQMRFLRDIVALLPFCEGVIVECAGRLVPLFRRSLPAQAVVVAADERREGGSHRFDYTWLASHPPVAAWIEMGSLMLRLHERGLPPDRRDSPPNH